jgi:hypothetical protein
MVGEFIPALIAEYLGQYETAIDIGVVLLVVVMALSLLR